MALPRGAVGWSAVCEIVLFPDHTHLLLETMTIKLILLHYLVPNVHRSIVLRHATENKQLIYFANSKGHNQNAFQTDDMKI